MNESELAAILSRNPDLSVGRPRSSPKLERTSRYAALGQSEAQKGDPSFFLVRITSVRKRLLDEDNLSEKYHVDCCRYAGIIPGDAPHQIKIETRQRKADKGEVEETIVEIYQ